MSGNESTRSSFMTVSTGITAISVGQLHASEMRKALKRFKASESNKKQFLKNEVAELCLKGLLQESERQVLDDVIELTFRFDDGERDSYNRVRKLYEKLIDDGSSPLAIAIVGVAVDSMGNQSTTKGIAGDDVSGAIGGASLGAAVGTATGPEGTVPGAIIGGLIGAVVGSVASAVDEMNE